MASGPGCFPSPGPQASDPDCLGHNTEADGVHQSLEEGFSCFSSGSSGRPQFCPCMGGCCNESLPTWCSQPSDLVLVFSPLLQVEEVKRRQYSLAFSSAGAQAQTYLVSFETLAEYQRWQRQASKVKSCQTSSWGDESRETNRKIF